MDLKEQNKALSEALENMNLLSNALKALNEIKDGLIDHKSQLIDGGAAECSITVLTINQLIEKTNVRK
jgi:hypothetical protein